MEFRKFTKKSRGQHTLWTAASHLCESLKGHHRSSCLSFPNTVEAGSPGWPRTYYVDQDGLEFTEIHMSGHLASKKNLKKCVFFNVWIFCVCVLPLCLIPEKARRGRWVPWAWSCETVVSCHVGAGNQTWVLWKNVLVWEGIFSWKCIVNNWFIVSLSCLTVKEIRAEGVAQW